MTHFIAVVILDESTARVVARGSRLLCERVAAGYVLETVVFAVRG